MECVRRKERDGVGYEVVRARVADVAQVGVGAPVAPGFDLFGWIAEETKGGGGSDPEGVTSKGGRRIQEGGEVMGQPIDGGGVREVEKVIIGSWSGEGEIGVEKADEGRRRDAAGLDPRRETRLHA